MSSDDDRYQKNSESRDHHRHSIENVWEYPRPPSLEKVSWRVRVVFGGVVIADTLDGWRILETSHPPTYYIPPKDIKMEYLSQVPEKSSYCEWKGAAGYYNVVANAIRNHVAFYASKMDECFVDEERVTPQAGDFYGGWVTSWISGGSKGFKGGPGTWGW